MRERQPERMLRVIAETTERVDVFRTRRVRTCLSLSVNKIHPSLHEPTLSASFLPYELCYICKLTFYVSWEQMYNGENGVNSVNVIWTIRKGLFCENLH